MKHRVIFPKSEADSEIRLARFIAELVRQGIDYRIESDTYSYEVELTGGF